MARKKNIGALFKTVVPKHTSNSGSSGYDNARENIDPHIRTKVIDTKEIIQDGVSYDLSVAAGAGNVVADANLTDETLVQGDGGAKKIKTSTATVTDVAANTAARHAETHDIASHDWANDWMIAYSNGTVLVELPFGDKNGKFLMSNGEAALTFETNLDATAHVADNIQAHSDYLLNSGADVAVGPLTITADNSSADQAYVPMVLYNTDDTPPAANTFPIGTLYVQYTA